MTQRVQINIPTYMPVDGQWQIVYPGSVVDIPATLVISPSCTLPVADAPGPLPVPTHATPVRNFRTR